MQRLKVMTINNLLAKIADILLIKTQYQNHIISKKIEKYYYSFINLCSACNVISIVLNDIDYIKKERELQQAHITLIILITILIIISLIHDCLNDGRKKIFISIVILACSLEYSLQVYLFNHKYQLMQFSVFILVLIGLSKTIYRTYLQTVLVFNIIIYLVIRVFLNSQLIDCLSFIIISTIMTLFINFHIDYKMNSDNSQSQKDIKNQYSIQANGKVITNQDHTNHVSVKKNNPKYQNFTDQTHQILNIDNLQSQKKVKSMIKEKEDDLFSIYANTILSSLQTGIALINNHMELNYCNSEMKKIFMSQDSNQVLENILEMKVKEKFKSRSPQLVQVKNIRTSLTEKDYTTKARMSNLVSPSSQNLTPHQYNSNFTLAYNNEYLKQDEVLHLDKSNTTKLSEMNLQNNLSTNPQNLLMDVSINIRNRSQSNNKDNISTNNKKLSLDQKNNIKKQLTDFEKRSKKSYQEKQNKNDFTKDIIKMNQQVNGTIVEKDYEEAGLSFMEYSNVQLKSAKGNIDGSFQKRQNKISTNDSANLKIGTITALNSCVTNNNKDNNQDLQLKQSIIPARVLQIFDNDEFTLQELIVLIFEQQDRALFNHYYSQNDIQDRMDNNNANNQVNDGQQRIKRCSIEKEENQDTVNYYIEKNNLIINIKQNQDTDLKYTQLRIGFYILKNNPNLEWNSQSFVMIEVFDQAQFSVNLKEQDILEYKNRMFASISHELRTPLNCSIQILQMLFEKLNQKIYEQDQESEFSEINLGLVKPALHSNKILLNIINDILDYGQINSGNLKLVFVSFNLFEVITECAELMYFQASQKGLTFELQFDSTLPEQIYTDQNRLKQVLLNLLSNSLKFTDKGSINIFVKCVNEELIRIDVKDTGCGIPDENLLKVLECFGNKQNQNILNTTGAGLGLSIANNLAMGLGGNRRIEVASNLKQGSCFSFYVVNRSLNKKGCEYKLKDVFNKKLVKWETLSLYCDNQSIGRASSINTKFLQQFPSRIKTLKQSQYSSLNTQASQVENIEQIQETSFINCIESLTKKVESGNGYEENSFFVQNDIQSNVITLTLKPNQIPTFNSKMFGASFSSLFNSQLHNIIPIEYSQKQKLNGRQLKNNSSFIDDHGSAIDYAIEHNEVYNSKKSLDNQKNQRNLAQFNQVGLINNLESCQVIEEQAVRYSISNVQERSIYNASKNIQFEQLDQANQKDNNENKVQKNNLEDSVTQSVNTETDEHQSVDVTNDLRSKNSPLSIKEKAYIQSQFIRSKIQQYGSDNSPVQQNQSHNSPKLFDQVMNSSQSTQIGKPIVNQFLKQFNSKIQCQCYQILVVDDNEFNLYALLLKLQTYGFRVDKAYTGQSAIEKVQNMFTSSTCCKKYKTILMDIDMPIKDGHQTTIEILNFYKYVKSNPPIISACSAFVQESEKQKAKQSGMQFYITKPVQTSTLEAFLLTVFQNQI